MKKFTQMIACTMFVCMAVITSSCSKEEVDLSCIRNVTESELESGTGTFYYGNRYSNKTYYVSFHNGRFIFSIFKGNSCEDAFSYSYSLDGDRLYLSGWTSHCLKILWIIDKEGNKQLYLFEYPDSTGSAPYGFYGAYYKVSSIRMY